MAEPSKESDQSMEDILQSIKRIIADEGDAAPAAQGSDVLELTELLAEDAAPPAMPEPAPAPAPKSAQDDIDALFNAAPSMPEPAPEPAPPPVPAPAPVMAPAPVAKPAPMPVTTAGLMSDSTLAASVAALNALAHPSAGMGTPITPSLRSGVTVEDLVVEALKPMLKDWLDGNLPELVRSLVEQEIRRMSAH